MAKIENKLYAALQQSEDAKKRYEKNSVKIAKDQADIKKKEAEIERVKALMEKDMILSQNTGANEMFSEFGFEGVEIRLGALLYAYEHIKASEDENKALDEFYIKGQEYLRSLSASDGGE